MNSVYILRSVHFPDQYYTGLYPDVEKRSRAHNAGPSTHMAKFKPWRLISSHFSLTNPLLTWQLKRACDRAAERIFSDRRNPMRPYQGNRHAG